MIHSPEVRKARAIEALLACGYRKMDLPILTGPKNKRLDHIQIRRDVTRYLLAHGFGYSAIARFYNQHHSTIMSLVNPRRGNHYAPK